MVTLVDENLRVWAKFESLTMEKTMVFWVFFLTSIEIYNLKDDINQKELEFGIQNQLGKLGELWMAQVWEGNKTNVKKKL